MLSQTAPPSHHHSFSERAAARKSGVNSPNWPPRSAPDQMHARTHGGLQPRVHGAHDILWHPHHCTLAPAAATSVLRVLQAITSSDGAAPALLLSSSSAHPSLSSRLTPLPTSFRRTSFILIIEDWHRVRAQVTSSKHPDAIYPGAPEKKCKSGSIAHVFADVARRVNRMSSPSSCHFAVHFVFYSGVGYMLCIRLCLCARRTVGWCER